LRIIDGDTIVVRVRIWLGQDLDTQVRLDGVDAPELNGRFPYKNRLALKARAFVQTRTAKGKVIIHDIHYGKYAGRVVPRVQMPGGENLSDALLRAGLGRVYQGRRWAS
jgi:endonuclease YncB( thermonuclease family)